MKATINITIGLLAAVLHCGIAFAQANPTYSAAVYLHQDPIAYLLDAEARMNEADKVIGHPPPLLEAMAGKAALEAGENTKALTYVTEAVATARAREADRRQRGFKDAQRHEGIGETYYYANFVLGRLAILKGDTRGAEQYLVASGQTIGGAVLNSYGPNMSLALELLRTGDAQSWQVVIQYINDIGKFWRIVPAPFDTWIGQITANEIPNFNSVGTNLYY